MRANYDCRRLFCNRRAVSITQNKSHSGNRRVSRAMPRFLSWLKGKASLTMQVPLILEAGSVTHSMPTVYSAFRQQLMTKPKLRKAHTSLTMKLPQYWSTST